MDIVTKTAKKLKIRPTRVFGLSYEYAENRCRRKIVINAYKEWSINGIMPDEVESFCIDVLAGRVVNEEITA